MRRRTGWARASVFIAFAFLSQKARMRFARRAMSMWLPSRMSRIVQLVEREVRAERLAVQRVGRHFRAMHRPPRNSTLVTSASKRWACPAPGVSAPVFRPQVQVHRVARLEAVSQASHCSSMSPTRKRLPPSACAAQHVDLADEVGDERRGGPLVDVHRRADLLDHAVVHHHDAVGHRQRFFLVVRDHDGRDAELLLQPADLAAQANALQRVERRQRLVEQQQAGPRRRARRQRDPLLLAADSWLGYFGPRSAGRPASAARRRAP